MLKFCTEYKAIFEVISYLVVAGSVPIAILSYYISKRKEISDREYGTFDSLDDKFIEFQMICMEKPYLNIFDIEDENPVELTPLQKKRKSLHMQFCLQFLKELMLCIKQEILKIHLVNGKAGKKL